VLRGRGGRAVDERERNRAGEPRKNGSTLALLADRIISNHGGTQETSDADGDGDGDGRSRERRLLAAAEGFSARHLLAGSGSGQECPLSRTSSHPIIHVATGGRSESMLLIHADSEGQGVPGPYRDKR